MWQTPTNITGLVTVMVYLYPHSRVGVYVGSEFPYPNPYPPNPYSCTPRVSETLAQHYSGNRGWHVLEVGYAIFSDLHQD